MKKIFLLFFIFFVGIINVCCQEININSKSAILMDYNTGSILYEQNSDERLPMASMTKMMSLFLIFEQIEKGNIKYDELITISKEAESMGGSQIYLKENEQYTVEDLLKAVIISSANDAIVALSQRTYGTIENFVSKMNEAATKMKLSNTNFENVHGLDSDNHYSSARDMAIVAKNLLKFENVINYSKLYEAYLKKQDGSQVWLVNTNKLVRFYDGVDGLKTGYTKNAGYCITTTAYKNNMRLIAVVMGSTTSEKRSEDVIKLLNYGFNNYKHKLLSKKNEYSKKVKVINGKKNYINVVNEKDISILYNIDEDESKYKYVTDIKNIKAPIKKGQVVGKIKVYNEANKEVLKINMVSVNNVDKTNFKSYFKYNLINILIGKN